MKKEYLAALEQYGKNCFRIVKGNITDNSFEVLHRTGESDINHKNPMESINGLEELWNSYLLDGDIYQEDLADFRQYVNLHFVSEYLKKYHGQEKFEIAFRCRQNQVYKPLQLEVVAAEDYTDENQSIYIFLMNAGNKLREDYVRFDELLRGLSENYGAIYYVDFDKDIIRPFRMNEAIENAFGDFFRSLPSYEAAINGYIDNVVSPKDRKMMREVTRYDFLKKQLSNERAYSHEYRLERNGREYIFRMKVANMEGIGPLHKAVVGFADVSMEKTAGYEISHSGRKILIADDNQQLRDELREILEAEYEVVAVEDGQAALEYLHTSYENIAIVITDLHMPVMNGDELIRKMKASRQYENIPIVVTTSTVLSDADKNDQMEIECLKLGATDFILKPYKHQLVLNRIKNFIRLRESTSMLSSMEKDPLTGLFTKEFFFLRAKEYMAAHPNQKYVMWASDILGLKLINEKYGLEMGDSVLKIMADDSDRFHGFIFGGRIEGDKFAALILEKNLPEYLKIVQKHDMGIGFPVPGVVIKHGFYHIRNGSTLPIQGMYDRALLALQKIKDAYGIYYAEYDDELRKDLLIHRQIAENARVALEEHQFQVYYQPKFDLHLGRTSGAEALIRWIHPELGFMNPGVFIPQFEQNGFIRELDLYVWEEVCKMLQKWKKEKRRLIPISVNASRRDFEDDNFAKRVIKIVDHYKLNHNYFHIEITESAYSDNPEKIAKIVKQFHESGFVVELDDFGSGYSSMSALSELDLDIMKLDMSIIQNDDPSSEKNILEFSMHLAKMLRLQTVAEGVETEEQVERISKLGGDYIQGYYFSKPLPKNQFEAYIEQEKQRMGRYVTYENVVNEARACVKKIEVKNIKEKLAVEFDILGGGEGAFYICFTPEEIEVAPYEYYDHDFRIKGGVEAIVELLNGETDMESAMLNGCIYITGNASKLNLLKAYMNMMNKK